MAIDPSMDAHTHEHTHGQQNGTLFQWDSHVRTVDLGNVFITFKYELTCNTHKSETPPVTLAPRVTLPFSVIVWLMSLLMFHMVHLWGYDLMYRSKAVCESSCMCVFCVCFALECKCVWLIVRGSLSRCLCTCECAPLCINLSWLCVSEACAWPSVIDYRQGVIGIISLPSGGLVTEAFSASPESCTNLIWDVWQVLWTVVRFEWHTKNTPDDIVFKAPLDKLFFLVKMHQSDIHITEMEQSRSIYSNKLLLFCMAPLRTRACTQEVRNNSLNRNKVGRQCPL